MHMQALQRLYVCMHVHGFPRLAAEQPCLSTDGSAYSPSRSGDPDTPIHEAFTRNGYRFVISRQNVRIRLVTHLGAFTKRHANIFQCDTFWLHANRAAVPSTLAAPPADKDSSASLDRARVADNDCNASSFSMIRPNCAATSRPDASLQDPRSPRQMPQRSALQAARTAC